MINLRFAILIPTHNEAADIRRTLDTAMQVSYPHKEILVIDDGSTDTTRDIVCNYVDRGVRLIEMPVNRGVAAARNIGLRATSADVVVILNADVTLPLDFLDRLLPYYAAGADFVVVEALAENMQDLFARYVQACHDLDYKAKPALGNVDWSEGWSCRREVALAVGGFPEEFPGASGEDAIFVKQLVNQHYRRVYASEIVVTHRVPRTLTDFWKQRLGRGRGVAYRRFGYEKVEPRLWPMLRAWLGMLLWIVTLIAPIWRAGRLARVSPRGWLDWPGMLWAVLLDMLGHQMGYWQAYRKIVEAKGHGARQHPYA